MAQMFRSAFKSLFRPFDHSKCFHSNYYYLDDPNQPQSLPNVDLEEPINVGGELHHPIHVEDFSKHVAQLHADGDIGFSKEYELIQNESIVDEHSSEHSQHSDNKAKNRYLNIIACKFVINISIRTLYCLHVWYLLDLFALVNVIYIFLSYSFEEYFTQKNLFFNIKFFF